MHVVVLLRKLYRLRLVIRLRRVIMFRKDIQFYLYMVFAFHQNQVYHKVFQMSTSLIVVLFEGSVVQC